MFENPILNELVKRYREKKLAHAYLIETNNYDKALQDLKEFIKIINCPEEYKKKCEKCNLCNLINKDNLPSIKIIEPDGASIKKVQMEELKEAFSTKPIYSRYNTYIIMNAEKLNSSSANSMLKFIEEPTDGIIGFFITNNKDVMIETIKSRCQSLILKYENKNIVESLGINAEDYNKYLEIIPVYLKKIESKELINNKKELLTIYPERKDVANIFQIIFSIYYENFLKMNNKEYNQNIANIYEIKEQSANLIKKLNIIMGIIQNLSYNVSIEQALDKFAIEMRDSNG